MTDTNPAGQPKPEPDLTFLHPNPEYNYVHLTGKLRTRRRVIIRSNKKALERQVTILLYLFRHESLTAVQLRSMMKLPAITGFRYMAVLTHCGLVKWKGSHKRGAYRITEEGKKFITDPSRF